MSADRTPAAERQAARRERQAEARELTAELAEEAAPARQQLALPGLPADRLADARAAAAEQLPLGPVARQEELAEPAERRGGRPAGSVAKRTAEWRRFMLGRYRSPLVVMAETYSRPAPELARLLGCSVLEAFELQMKAAAELAPYLHSKQPTALQLDAPAIALGVTLTPGMAAAVGVQPLRIAQPGRVVESEADQGDSGEGGA